MPRGESWQYEPKWDGFRCLAYRDGDEVFLASRNGRPLARYFPDLVEKLRAAAPPRFVVDGEIVIPVDGRLSFDELSLRLHPAASRVAKLAAAHPAEFVLFDLLATPEGRQIAGHPFIERRAVLEKLFNEGAFGAGIRLSPMTRDFAQAKCWLDVAGGDVDGVVAKRLDAPYDSGGRDAMIKVKRMRTADCVVGGFRTGKNDDLVASLLLGLYDQDGKLVHVGFTSGLKREERPALTARLQKLIKPPGFDRNPPGGPSRWNRGEEKPWFPLKPALVVEVRFDHVSSDRFRHGTTLLRFRPDKKPRECGMEQLER
ncbi:MAG: dependent ligase [Rhodospirillales bacterium]|nr:dependent ligase [Rhodospirillales bacterium]